MNPIKEIVLALLVGLVVLGCTWLAGANHNEQKWLAKQAKGEREAHVTYEAEVKTDNAAARSYLTDNRALQTDYQALTEKFNALKKRTPLVAINPAVPGNTGQPGCVSEAPVGEADNGGRVDSALHLSTGAVWMWNSALTGKDQPAGECSALDPTSPACAAATGITIDDAWDNHARNAQICAEDRLAHQRLIDLLKQREGAKP
jgi:hypothetical protein